MTETYPPEAVNKDVLRLLELNQATEQITAETNAIKTRLRGLGTGEHLTACGATVSISAPNRTFNLTRAVAMLTDEQRELAKGYEAKKIKQFLAPALLDACMDPGAGELKVFIK